MALPCDCDLDEEASMPESLPSDTETEQLVDTTELADEPLAKFNIHVWDHMRGGVPGTRCADA